MQVLQGMDPDKMVIIFPSALIAMYIILTLQKHLSEKENPYPGLVLPVICFIAATVLAIKPLFADEGSDADGLFLFCIRMWLTFNIPTLVFLFPYWRSRKLRRAMMEAQAKEAAGAEEVKDEVPHDDDKG